MNFTKQSNSSHLNSLCYNSSFRYQMAILIISLKTIIYKVVNWDLIYHLSRGHAHMVVGFTTTYAIIAYHHWCCEFESRPGRGVQHYVIKFVSALRRAGGSLRVLYHHDISEILLKVALNITKQTNKQNGYLHFLTCIPFYRSINFHCHLRHQLSIENISINIEKK